MTTLLHRSASAAALITVITVGEDELGFTASAAEVRQRSAEPQHHRSKSHRYSMPPSTDTSSPSASASSYSGLPPRAPGLIRNMSADQLAKKNPANHLPLQRHVSQLSALRQLALSIEQQTAQEDNSSDRLSEHGSSGSSTPRGAVSKAATFSTGDEEDEDERSAGEEGEHGEDESAFGEYNHSTTRPTVYDVSPEDVDGETHPLLGPPSDTPHRPRRAHSGSHSRRRSKWNGQGWARWKPDWSVDRVVKCVKGFRPRDLLTWSGLVAAVLPAVVLGVILNLLDAMSYGIIIFPNGDPNIPKSAPQAGISMFFASTVIAQLVYSLGGSGFKGVNGSMMIEVMPFLHIICRIIESQMRDAPQSAILATMMVAFAMSTILTGIVFLVLGLCRLGNVIQFFPRHILVGCIGGIGLFLIYTGIEVTSHVPLPSHPIAFIRTIFTPPAIQLWGTSLLLALFLKALQNKVTHPLFVPIYYVCIPVVFYIIVAIGGWSITELRKEGWLFDVPEGEEAPFWTFWTWYKFSEVQWSAIPATIPTQLALTFFGILHVPINVPALAVSTHQEVDVNREIIGHGISNLAAGFVGTCQNYLVYSNSVLYIRSGGNSRLGGLLLAVATAAVWVAGDVVLGYVPTIVVGSLIFHLGIDLLKESVVDTWNIGIHPLEYLTIIAIVAIMGIWGFTEGIVVGIILACVFFVVMYSRRNVIRASFTGSQLRSTVHRLYRQQMFLDQVGDQIHIIKLQGFMFFGTINQLDIYMLRVLDEHPLIRFIVVDFSLISGIDYSALETFLRIKRILRERATHLVFCGLSGVGRELMQSGIFDEAEEEEDVDEERAQGGMGKGSGVHNFGTLNEALEWCENRLLAAYYKRKSEKTMEIPGSTSENTIAAYAKSPARARLINGHAAVVESMSHTPREKEVMQAASLVLRENPPPPVPATRKFHPVSILMQAFSEMTEYADELTDFCEDRFERVEVSKGTVLWVPGDEAKELYVLEEGELVLLIPDRKELKVVETLLPGTMVGELEMFSDRPRSCRLVANDDSVVWRLSKESFDAMADENPKLMLKFVTKVAVSFDAVRFYNTIYHWAQLR
ncbi:hypothetical protein HK104_001585 [Borealophlyctis nickersoniae]|nr:hypothetical protein HK104_001585 [Borealophlyctis nickersoniae]